ncbi:DUF7010 family protein [Agromyces sp. NPDC058484]|uniref:DUF7010 family protein n=1 Tax=Agromyces sp. NPDC058484 TaxID=3346524 RepID=UPI00365E3AB1
MEKTAQRDSSTELEALQTDLSTKTGRGVNFIVAGVILWSAFAVLGAFLTNDVVLALAYAFGAGLLFPLSLLVARAMKLDPYAKGNPLGALAGLLGAVQILFIPLMLGATFAVPHVVPWFLAVLVGAHLLPYAWLYNSRAYLFASIGIPVAAGLVGWLLRALVPIAAPSVTAVLLAVTAFMLARENGRSMRRPPP